MGNDSPPEVDSLIGFSAYVQAHACGWTSGITTVWCYECRAFSVVMDDTPTRTFRCSRLSMHDLLLQSEHLDSLKPDEDEEAESA